MKLYKFDKDKMNYVHATKSYLIVLGLIVLSNTFTFFYGYFNQVNKLNSIEYITEETKMLIISEQNEFSEAKLKEYILELNIKFPHIVLAQAQLETGFFKSKIFKENNNLFGMKLARRRPRTALGVENNHAYYNNWKESVLDYALFAAAYLSDIKTEHQYLEYLKANYAEDPLYFNKLLKLIKR